MEHTDLLEKKNALRSALCAARGTVTKFDQIASFWQDLVLEPEEKEREQQRRIRKAKAEAAARAPWETRAKFTRSKSATMFTGGESTTRTTTTTTTTNSNEIQIQQQSSCQQQLSCLSSCLLLLQPSSTLDKSRGCEVMDRRCDSVGDRGTRKSSGLMGGNGMAASMPAKPKPEPIEIKIDLERILPPVEDAAAAVVVNAFVV